MADLSRRDLFRRLTGRPAESDAAAGADADVGEEAEQLSPLERAGRELAARRKNRRCRLGGRPADRSDDQ